eukprot:646890-Prymnesium_polylepis.1
MPHRAHSCLVSRVLCAGGLPDGVFVQSGHVRVHEIRISAHDGDHWDFIEGCADRPRSLPGAP